MSENYKQRSILEIMNDVLGTIRDYYDSEYVYYIERDEEEILTIYEWCAEFVPWQRDKIKMLDKEQWPRWIRQDITDTTEADYSVSQPLEDGITAVLAAVGVHRGGWEISFMRSLLPYISSKSHVPALYSSSFSWYIVIDSSNSHLQIYFLLSINLFIRG